MTRARSLKQIIRARAAKTGERYTAARRHVLKGIATAMRPAGTRLSDEAATSMPETPALDHTDPGGASTSTRATSTATNLTRGAVSDAKVREKTGHGLDHWFVVLDRFGGVEKGHTAAAKHLYADHGIPGWYAQGITVAYERARGVRASNQRVSGDYEVSISKVVTGDTQAVVNAFADARWRRQWLAVADPELARALSTALSGASSKGFVVRPDGQGRFRYKWGATTVQMNVLPKADGRVTVVVTHMKLPDAAALETHRAEWRAALASLARHFGSTS